MRCERLALTTNGVLHADLPRPFETGDRVRLHDDGTFDHLGRADGVVKIGGRRVSIREVEECIRSHPGVEEVAVVAVPAEGGPSERALAINISELQNRSEAQKILCTHANNRISAGSPVFDLTTGDVFAIHVGSEPDPGAPGRRRGYGYSLRHLLDMVRASIRGAKLGPVCPD